MSGIQFEWDEEKAAGNLSKHGISFIKATKVFLDRSAMEELDRNEHDEHRHFTIGIVDSETLFVVFTLRGDRIRLISARRATRHEAARYWEDRLLYA
ncbi:BrnT family toxin [Bacillus sp. NP157]|nr:BrnT family toxin [Bacillus sp. NP157]